jgi:DNA-binding IclR family transcriptional regulator
VTSTGKAMLAWMPSEALDVAFSHTRKFTALTLTRRKDIERISRRRAPVATP